MYAVFFVLWGISACSKQETVYQSAQSTLRSQTENMLSSVEWAPPLYADGIPSVPVFAIEAPLPQALGALPVKKDIYPEYKDFGVLDLSSVPEGVFHTADKFLNNAAVPPKNERNIETALICSDYPFLQMVLTAVLEPLPPVVRWLYAKPQFIPDTVDGAVLLHDSGGVWQLPARLFSKNCYTDMVLFVRDSGSSYTIEQIYCGEQIYE